MAFVSSFFQWVLLGVSRHRPKGPATTASRRWCLVGRAPTAERAAQTPRLGTATLSSAIRSPESIRTVEPRYCRFPVTPSIRVEAPPSWTTVAPGVTQRASPRAASDRASLDVVEEDRIPLVEHVVVGKNRSADQQTTRRRLGHGPSVRKIVVEHAVLPQSATDTGNEESRNRTAVRRVLPQTSESESGRAVANHPGRRRVARHPRLWDRASRKASIDCMACRLQVDVGVEQQHELS